VKQISDGIYCQTAWEGANVGAISTGEGLILIDSPMLPRDARAWKEALARIGDEQPLFLVNTDYHFDHIMTDCLLCERVIAHILTEPAFAAQDGSVFEQMVSVFFPQIDDESRREIRTLRTVPPFITFSERLVLAIGSRRIEITRMGGHTPATAVVHVPDDGILFTGDVHVHDRHPFPGDGNLLEWIDALDRIQEMDVQTIIPGHGEPCDLRSVARLKQFFEDMKGRVGDLMRQGCGRDEVERRVDMLACFPVDEGKEARTESFVRLGVGRMFSQLAETNTTGSRA
jgi:cyclase